jgi:hypothetical protein
LVGQMMVYFPWPASAERNSRVNTGSGGKRGLRKSEGHPFQDYADQLPPYWLCLDLTSLTIRLCIRVSNYRTEISTIMSIF